MMKRVWHPVQFSRLDHGKSLVIMGFSFILILTGLTSCSESGTENDIGRAEETGEHGRSTMPSSNYHRSTMLRENLRDVRTTYVPIYSDIYHINGERRYRLTATLSIRNTDMSDSMYVLAVRYFDSEGIEVRTYLKQTIVIPPLGSVEFVVEDRDDVGGAGANFLVEWGGMRQGMKPVIQAVMISTSSQQGISFVTEGVEIDNPLKDLPGAELYSPTSESNRDGGVSPGTKGTIRSGEGTSPAFDTNTDTAIDQTHQ